MRYISDFSDGDRISDIYLCKHRQSAVTKNGKSYDNVILQDKTGTIDAKVWDPNSSGIEDYDILDYVEVNGEVSSYNGALQLSIKRIRKCAEGEYDQKDYLPVSPYDIEQMYHELTVFVNSVENRYLKTLLESFFIDDQDFIKKFKFSSAAKSVHHGFVGGLLQHTISVTRLCDFYCTQYKHINRDLLITAALCHDIAKTKEISPFPLNDYTDSGNLLGHIVMGVEMIDEKIKDIDGFPPLLADELRHCILAHHGEYEYGSPKKPAIIEAVALNFADNTDAKIEIFSELLDKTSSTDWMGFNRLFDSNVKPTKVED